MKIPIIFEREYQLCLLVWENEPICSTSLVKLCRSHLHWSKSTTYTVIRRLSEKGVLENSNAIVSSLISKEQVQNAILETSVYKGYKQDKIEMRGDRAEMSDFPLYLNTVAGGLDCRDQTIGGFSFVVKIYAVPVVEIIG